MGYFLLLWHGGVDSTPLCHSQMHDFRKLKFGVDVAPTFLDLLTKFHFPGVSRSRVTSRVAQLAGITCAMPFHAMHKQFGLGRWNLV